MQQARGTTEAPLAAPLLVGARAGLLGCLVTLFAAAAHVTAHGLLPPWPLLVLVVTAAAAVCAPLAQRELSTRVLLVLCCAGQAALHAAFTLLAGHADGPASAAVASCAGGTDATASFLQGPGGEPVRACASSLDAVTGLISPTELPMAAAHLAAAAVLALLLARGEHALWSLLALLAALAAPVRRAARLLVLVRPQIAVAGSSFAAPFVAAVGRPGDVFRTVAPRRGPPTRS